MFDPDTHLFNTYSSFYETSWSYDGKYLYFNNAKKEISVRFVNCFQDYNGKWHL
jgi:hypothetical protein